MVEFALVAPVFFAALLGALDGGLLMFSAGAVNHATGIGMITVAQEGTTANADTAALTAMMAGGAAAIGFAKVDEVDIYLIHVDPTTGAVTQDTNSCGVACVDRYGWNGAATTILNPATGSAGCLDIPANSLTCIPPWPPGARDTSFANVTNIGITVKCHYSYLAFTAAQLNITQTRYFRLEPTS
jgi:Flp pilus assembly protein TadG